MFYYYNQKSKEFTESTREITNDPTLLQLSEEKYNLWRALGRMNYQNAQEMLDEWFENESYSPRCDFCRANAVYEGWSKPNDSSYARILNVCEEHVTKLRGSKEG